MHIPLKLTPRASRRQHDGRGLLGEVRWDEKSIDGLSVSHFKPVCMNVCVHHLRLISPSSLEPPCNVVGT